MSEKSASKATPIYLDPHRQESEASGVSLFDQFGAGATRIEDIWDFEVGEPLSSWVYPVSGDLLALIHEHGAVEPSRADLWDALQRVAAVAQHGALPRDVRSYWERAGARAIQREVRLALGAFMPGRAQSKG